MGSDDTARLEKRLSTLALAKTALPFSRGETIRESRSVFTTTDTVAAFDLPRVAVELGQPLSQSPAKDLALLVLMGFGCSVVQRTVGALYGRTFIDFLVIDQWIATMVMAAATITIEPRIWPSAAVFFVGGVIVRAFPDQSHRVFSVTMFLAVALLGLRVWLIAREKKKGR